MKQPNGATHWVPPVTPSDSKLYYKRDDEDQWYLYLHDLQGWKPVIKPPKAFSLKAPEDSPRNKYQREIKPGVWVDVYDVLNAFDPDNRNAADDHAIKKMLLPGKRGVKDGKKDRQEAIQSLQRSIELLGDE